VIYSDLPCSEDSLPILAHRAARVVMLDNGGVRFYPVHTGMPGGVPFHVDARATCPKRNSPHAADAPHPECSCGFYSVPLHIPAEHGYNRWYTVDLMVELHGRIVVHEYGYRAAFQRILECRLLPCNAQIRFDVETSLTVWCPRPAVSFTWAKAIHGLHYLLTGRCGEHADRTGGKFPPVLSWSRDRFVDALAPIPVSDLHEKAPV
jgi:hypothetical protein